MKQLCIVLTSMVMMIGLSISSGYSANVTLYPTADTYVDSSTPEVAYGDSYDLYAGYYSYSNYRSFLKFDLSSIPDNSVITFANLTLIPYYGLSTNFIINVDRVDNDTSVLNTMTWDTQPSIVEHMDSETVIDASPLTWNLLSSGAWIYSTDLLDNFLSLRLSKAIESEIGFYIFFSSNLPPANSGMYPKLDIQFQPQSAVPVLPAVWLLGSGLIGFIGLRRKFFRN